MTYYYYFLFSFICFLNIWIQSCRLAFWEKKSEEASQHVIFLGYPAFLEIQRWRRGFLFVCFLHFPRERNASNRIEGMENWGATREEWSDCFLWEDSGFLRESWSYLKTKQRYQWKVETRKPKTPMLRSRITVYQGIRLRSEAQWLWRQEDSTD